MAKRRQRYTIAHPLEAVRRLVGTPEHVGQGLAFVAATEERGGRPFWRLRPAMATITGAEGLTLDFRTGGPGEVRWQGESPRLVSRGEIILRPGGVGATDLDLTLEMAGVGLASAVIEPLASMQIENQMDHFVDRLEAALGPAVSEGEKAYVCR